MFEADGDQYGCPHNSRHSMGLRLVVEPEP